MEITFYNALDPRRLMQTTFKSLNDVAPILSGNGEPVVINSLAETTFDGLIPVFRDLTLTGKIKTSFLLHGNTNLVVKDAILTNAQSAGATIFLANDFTGTIHIINSQVNYKSNVGQGYAVSVQGNPDKRAELIEIVNSTVDGLLLMPVNMVMQGSVNINSVSKQYFSLINASKYDLGNAQIKAKILHLMNPGESAQLQSLEVLEGPVTLEGKWSINQILINDNKSMSLLKFDGKRLESTIAINNLSINKAPKGISVLYSDNVILEFNNSKLGDSKTKYNAAINNSVIRMNQTTDYLHWNISGKDNGLELDETSITELRTKQNKFQPIGKVEIPHVKQEDKEKADMESVPKLPDEKIDITQKGQSEDNVQKADGMAQLNEMIGLKSVKEALTDYVMHAEANKERQRRHLKVSKGIRRHMVFGGNPGTGKTTVAEHVAQILYERGALRRNHTSEITSKDLISNHIGETTIKTHNAVKEALGGILFIDEAYMLNAKGNQFAPEAVDQLLRDMEAHRDDLIVIFAGYTKQMHDFIDNGNPGLASRIGKWIDFPDYSEKEELEIFKLMCKHDGTLINSNYLNTKMFKYTLKFYNRDHANGRSVGNYYNALTLMRDRRLGKSGFKNLSNEEMMTISAEDIKSVYKASLATLAKEKKLQTKKQLSQKKETNSNAI